MVGSDSQLREGNDLPFAEPILPSDLGHLSQHREELMGWIGPCLSVPGRSKETATELPLGKILNEYGGGTRNRLTHVRGLSSRGLGATIRAEISGQYKGFVAEPAI